MTLPFYFTTSITTKLSKEEITSILLRNTITDNGKSFKDKRVFLLNKRQFDTSKKNCLYKNRITKSGFRIYRILEKANPIGNRNSFNPFCFGKFEQLNNTNIISLKFRSAIFVLVFMFIWMSGVILGTIEIFLASLDKGGITEALITPVALSPFYVGFWIFHRFFKKEVNRTLIFFTKIGIG